MQACLSAADVPLVSPVWLGPKCICQQVLTRRCGWRAGGAERSVGPVGLSEAATRLADSFFSFFVFFSVFLRGTRRARHLPKTQAAAPGLAAAVTTSHNQVSVSHASPPVRAGSRARTTLSISFLHLSMYCACFVHSVKCCFKFSMI